VDVWAEEAVSDSPVKIAQPVKLLIQTIQTNALSNQLVINSQSDSLEMQPHVVDAKDVTGHHKFQTQLLELDVLLDQDHHAHVLKDTVMKVTHALSAHSDKLEQQLEPLEHTTLNASTHQLAMLATKFNLLLTLHHVEDAKLANSHNSSLMSLELNVLPDHLLLAQIALKDNQMMDTHVLLAQLVQSKIQLTLRDVLDQPALDNIKSNLLSTTSNVVLVRLANGQHTCQILPETNAFKDHLLLAQHALKDNQMMDTHVLLAQLDKSKTPTMQEYATLQYVTECTRSNCQSTKDHAENAKHANGQDKCQTMRELPVLTDHSLNAQTASREDQMTTTLVNNAHSDKSKTHKTKTDVSLELAMVLDKSNLLLITPAVEDVKLANGHNSPQTRPRLNVLLDQWLFVTADRDNHKMDTHVKLAQLDKFKVWPTKSNVLDQTAQDNMKSNSQLIPTTVEDVRPANGHNLHQTHQEPNALLDHLLTATASVEDQDLDTLVRDANQEPSKIQTMSTNVLLHTAVDHTKSLSHLTKTTVESVRIANTQDTFQTMRELNAFWDHLPNAIASADNHKTDTHVKLVTTTKSKTQETHKDVLILQDVTKETKFLVLEIPKTAWDAEHALPHKSQELTDQSATDQDQLAHALRDTQLMDTAASHAPTDKFLMKLDKHATQHHNASDQEKFLEPDKTATDATNAHQTLFQMIPELNVSDQSQFAHAPRDTHQTDMSALNAPTDKLLIQTTTRDASHKSVTKETTSSQPENTATDVTSAHKDTSQTHKELSASESSQSAHVPKSTTQVDTSVFHAHHGKLLPIITKDVSQDNAQESMRFLVMLQLAMPVKNAKRDPPQTTWEEDA
jgi:hypothetical protein